MEGQEDNCPKMFTDMDFELEEDKLWVAKYVSDLFHFKSSALKNVHLDASPCMNSEFNEYYYYYYEYYYYYYYY